MLRNDAVVGEVVRLYNDGFTGEEVGRELGIPVETVYEWLRWAGVKRRPRGMVAGSSRLAHDEFVVTRGLYERGYSTTEIGRLLGLSPSTVVYRLRRAGVEMRDRSVTYRMMSQRKANSNGGS